MTRRSEYIDPVKAREAEAHCKRALGLVREARDLLKRANARRACMRVAGVVHSVEGAARHAEMWARDAERRRAQYEVELGDFVDLIDAKCEQERNATKGGGE